ncbi:MAG: hypothetical protein AAGJ87_00025 [Pseudomonadota bacterium]
MNAPRAIDVSAASPILTDVSVRRATLEDNVRWRAFLERASGAAPFHEWGWGDAVEAAYGYQTQRIIAERDALLSASRR